MENNENQAIQQQPEPAPAPVQKTSLGMEENIEGLLCYLFGWLSGLVLLLVEKNSKFVRFHAVQSLVVGGAVTVLYILLNGILMSMFWSLWGVIPLLSPLFGLHTVPSASL